MLELSQPLLAAAGPGFTSGGAVGFLGLATVALLVLVALLLSLLLIARRRLDSEVRDLVQALEEVRGGRGRPHVAVQPHSPLALVDDAVQRLAHDMHTRQLESDRAVAGWRALTDAARQTAIVTTDGDGDIRSFSPGATTLFGWDTDDIVSRPAAVLFEESAYRDLLPKLARRSLRKEGVTTRATLLRRDGEAFDAEITVRLLDSEAEQGSGFLLVVRDVTEQVHLEERLRASEERYRHVIEGLGEGVLLVRSGRIAYANPAAERLIGLSRQALLGTALRERVATGDVLVVEERLQAIEAGQVEQQELRCHLIGGEGRPGVDVRIGLHGLDDGDGRAALLLVRDESEQRRAVAELQSNQARLDAVLEATTDGILLVTDPSEGQNVLLGNRAFAELLDVGLEQILGASQARLLRLLHERGELGQGVARAIASGEAGRHIEIVSVAGPVAREMQVVVSPLFDADGRRLGRVVACRDLTDQKTAERQLQTQADELQLRKVELEQSHRRLARINGELEQRTGELDALNQELRRLDEMKSSLLGNVSHELQTPLVSIRGYTEMILKERLGPITEEQRHGLGLSLKNIDRLISMIDNLLSFSRHEPELGELSLRRFDLVELLREALDTMRERVELKRIDARITTADGPLTVEADRDKVLQVLLNLLSNAIKFTPEGGAVALHAAPGEAGYVAVRVRDSGPGIPADQLGRVFERRYQVSASDGRRPSGSGLGLAIVRDILRLHGCTIEAGAAAQGGAELTFTLPRARSTSVVEGPPSAPATAAHPVGPPPAEPRAVPVEAAPPRPVEGDRVGPAPRDEGPNGARKARPRFRVIRRYRPDE